MCCRSSKHLSGCRDGAVGPREQFLLPGGDKFTSDRQRAGHLVGELRQTDTFYRVANGRLKLRVLGNGDGQLIAYARSDVPGPKLSQYSICRCDTSTHLHDVLAATLGVRGVVEKTRRVVHVGQTRAHLDTVSGLGEFVELEVVLEPGQRVEHGRQIAYRLLHELGIEEDALLSGAYIDMLEAAS